MYSLYFPIDNIGVMGIICTEKFTQNGNIKPTMSKTTLPSPISTNAILNEAFFVDILPQQNIASLNGS